MTKLQELAQLNGLTMKQLSTASEIPYTTLETKAKKPVSHWDQEFFNRIALALRMSLQEFQEAVESPVLSPFVKWVGGKRQLLPDLVHFLPDQYDRYFEPFVGGGALLLRLTPSAAVINDANSELTNAWLTVRDELDELVNVLKKYEAKDSKEFYLDIRSVDRDGRILQMTRVERAARFIYLNKAGYNGLWRVNSKGQNNVPYGAHKKLNLVSDSLVQDSKYLNENHVDILTGDFEDSVQTAVNGDLVYFDPPYVPVNQTSAFTTYTRNGFGLVQQELLRDTAERLANTGVKVMLSNSDVALVRELYKSKIFKIHEVQAMRYVNSNAQERGKVGELIITTY